MARPGRENPNHPRLELEPELTIQEDDHQVSIKGGLHLLGQYVPFDQNESFEDYEGGGVPQRIDSVRTTENGEREIKHFFPIEVSIPLNRIQSVEELYVQVDSFDYDLPEPSCIQLAADVTITGMIDEHQDAKAEKTIASPPEPFPRFTHEVKVPEEEYAEERYEEEEEEENDVTHESWSSELDEDVEELEEEPFARDEVKSYYDAQEVADEDTDRIEHTAFVDDHNSNDDESTEEAEEEQRTGVEEEKEDVHLNLNSHRAQEEPSHDSAVRYSREPLDEEPEDHHEEDVEEEPQKPEKRRENALYLTEMLEKGDRETFTKMKMCIIQDNESLDTIAERYGFSVQQLLRWNNMDMNHVEAGEIIYIPVQAQHE
ncbi:stage VI sporulation protein D [Geomicrobium sp. JCM 19037]|uniref:stage VI sporulation protein D n=1 Tax=Geomicrobium sp. JCM 19037 TaxID=1460634 RepID=UPI00045F2DC9|nr:stage VI sporulation protein D [Geomicrobium sp. JCM 19037]GAK03183.1 stage VI sporulation protein D [Geomicrobium sp. JCM 19037]